VVNIRLRSAMAARFPVAKSGSAPLIRRSPKGHQMTLVEQLRSKKKALTVEELADILCIAIRTLYKEVEDDHIPFFRVRTSIRFDPHQIADWLEGKMPSHSISAAQRPDAGLRA
jgi:excisionase family DNA binding protein